MTLYATGPAALPGTFYLDGKDVTAQFADIDVATRRLWLFPLRATAQRPYVDQGWRHQGLDYEPPYLAQGHVVWRVVGRGTQRRRAKFDTDPNGDPRPPA